MLLLRTSRAVLSAMWLYWSVWATMTSVLVPLVWQAGATVRTALVAVFLGPILSLIAHEYGHAHLARMRGAIRLTLVRSRWSVAISHEHLDDTSHALIALGGPLASVIAAGMTAGLGVVTSIPQLYLTAAIVGAGAASALPWAHDGRTIMTTFRRCTQRPRRKITTNVRQD